jgi:hypothetical protein
VDQIGPARVGSSIGRTTSALPRTASYSPFTPTIRKYNVSLNDGGPPRSGAVESNSSESPARMKQFSPSPSLDDTAVGWNPRTPEYQSIDRRRSDTLRTDMISRICATDSPDRLMALIQ